VNFEANVSIGHNIRDFEQSHLRFYSHSLGDVFENSLCSLFSLTLRPRANDNQSAHFEDQNSASRLRFAYDDSWKPLIVKPRPFYLLGEEFEVQLSFELNISIGDHVLNSWLGQL
jgi:hypothetical protein